MRAPDHRQHIFLGEPDEDLIESLEPDQLVSATHIAVPRRHLQGAVAAGLWALRIFLLAVTAMVIYVFVVGIARGAA